jgi:hypothetical protein
LFQEEEEEDMAITLEDLRGDSLPYVGISIKSKRR